MDVKASQFIYRITTNSPWPILDLPNYVVYSTKALQRNSLSFMITGEEFQPWLITATCRRGGGLTSTASEITDLITNITITDRV